MICKECQSKNIRINRNGIKQCIECRGHAW